METKDLPIEIRDILSQFCKHLSDVIIHYQESRAKSRIDYESWQSNRQELLAMLRTVLDGMRERRKNVNIANITGSSVSLASGIACIGGIALSPFTAGASLALTVGGLIGTGAGTITTLGADAAEFFLTKEDLAKVTEALESDGERSQNLKLLMEDALETESNLTRMLKVNFGNILKAHKQALERSLTEPGERDAFYRIMNGRGWLNDYAKLLSLFIEDEQSIFDELREINDIRFDGSQACRVNKVISSLLRSIASGLQCAKLFTTLQTGSIALKVASKAPSFIKGAVVFFSMIPDAINIGLKAKEMINEEETDDIKNMRNLIEKLEHDTENIVEYFDSRTRERNISCEQVLKPETTT